MKSNLNLKHTLSVLAIVILGSTSLVGCGGGFMDCATKNDCEEYDASLPEELDPEDDPFYGCWREGVDSPVFGVPSCERVAQDQKNPYITK